MECGFSQSSILHPLFSKLPMTKLWQKYQLHFETLFILLLSAAVRLTSLNVFRAVDEEDRWAWAVDFYRALLAGDLSATLVGDGYPGIFPVWLETIWLCCKEAGSATTASIC